MQGIIGAVISQRSSTVFFFWVAKCFAILTAVTVLPQPGLPQTARMPPPDSSIGSSSSGSVLRRKRLPFRKFIRRPHFLRKAPRPRFPQIPYLLRFRRRSPASVLRTVP